MERRNFIKFTVAGIGASVVAPTLALAESEKKLPAAADIFYTKDAPGRWSAKVATHLPTIQVEKAADKVTVKVVTGHEMKGYEHYIVKHVLLDKDYKFLDERMFDPTKDKEAVSSYTLENYHGTIYALSMCNKHDLWLNSAEV
jgi:superoxide reductase